LSLLLLGASLLVGMPTSTCASVLPAAHQDHSSRIYGQVTDPTGVGLGHAQLLLKKMSGERVYRSADEKGCYSFVATPGEYMVLARAQAFRSGSATVHLTQGGTESANLALDVAGCTNCVKVEGAGSIGFEVQDQAGIPVATSTVTLQLVGETRQIRVQLDDWGWDWVQPPIGRYVLNVSAPGFRSFHKTVLIKDGHDPVMRITLSPAHSESTHKNM
jgi:hypothetical protein